MLKNRAKLIKKNKFVFIGLFRKKHSEANQASYSIIYTKWENILHLTQRVISDLKSPPLHPQYF